MSSASLTTEERGRGVTQCAIPSPSRAASLRSYFTSPMAYVLIVFFSVPVGPDLHVLRSTRPQARADNGPLLGTMAFLTLMVARSFTMSLIAQGAASRGPSKLLLTKPL